MAINLKDFREANELSKIDAFQYRSLGQDPNFLYECPTGTGLAAGSYSIKCHIGSDSMTVAPCIYIDTGNGFSESTKITLPAPKNREVRFLANFPEMVKAFRFDPCECEGDFTLKKLQIKRNNKVSRILLLLTPYVENILKNPKLSFSYLGKFFKLIFSGGDIEKHLIHAAENKQTYNFWLLEAEKKYGFNDKTKLEKDLSFRPKISILMPTFNTNSHFFKEAVQSVLKQSYTNWQLCIADDASTDDKFISTLRTIATLDPRISVVWRKHNGHISAASNSALSICDGDFICLLDHDDVIHAEALAEFAININENKDIDVWYSDEDKLTTAGEFAAPTFKPDWAPHLLFSQQYIGHLVCIRKECILKVEGFREDVNGSQDYDLLLRLANENFRFAHIPKVLYHWREHVNSTALNPDSKPYAHVAGELTVSRELKKRYGEKIFGAEGGEHLFTYRPMFNPDKLQAVSIIIPTRDRIDLLSVCIESILIKTVDIDYEIIIVDNGSVKSETFEYFDALKENNSNIKVIRADIEFNWSKLNNIGASVAQHNIFLFLNNDIEVIEPKWLFWLSGYASLDDVGSVGALLLYPDHTIQHAGVVLGMGGWADHVYKGARPAHIGSPFTSPLITRNVLANTGACMAIERSKFESVGGFDEEFIVCGSDVEICLRLESRSFTNVFCPYAKLFHYESKSRDPSKVPENDFQQSAIKYEPYRTKQCDPYFNQNLDMFSPTPQLKRM